MKRYNIDVLYYSTGYNYDFLCGCREVVKLDENSDGKLCLYEEVKSEIDGLRIDLENALKSKDARIWHPVSEIPQKLGDYLVVLAVDKSVRMMVYGDNGWMFDWYISHWMELPSPPEVK